MITARLAKRAKVMFSLCVSVHRGGGGPKVQYFRGGGVPRSNIFGGGGAPITQRPPSPEKFWKIFFWKNFWKFFIFFFFGQKKFFWGTFFFQFFSKMATKNGDKKKWWQKKWRRKGGGCGRYASCGHAGGLSCLVNFLDPISSHEIYATKKTRYNFLNEFQTQHRKKRESAGKYELRIQTHWQPRPSSQN